MPPVRRARVGSSSPTTMCPKPFAGEGDPGLTQNSCSARVLERASDAPPSERALKPLVFMVFSMMPEGVRLLEGGVFGLPEPEFKSRTSPDNLELAEEIGKGKAKYIFRVELEMAGEVGQRGEEIAKFLRTLGLC